MLILFRSAASIRVHRLRSPPKANLNNIRKAPLRPVEVIRADERRPPGTTLADTPIKVKSTACFGNRQARSPSTMPQQGLSARMGRKRAGMIDHGINDRGDKQPDLNQETEARTSRPGSARSAPPRTCWPRSSAGPSTTITSGLNSKRPPWLHVIVDHHRPPAPVRP